MQWARWKSCTEGYFSCRLAVVYLSGGFNSLVALSGSLQHAGVDLFSCLYEYTFDVFGKLLKA